MKKFSCISRHAMLLLAFAFLASSCSNQEKMHFKKGELLYDKALPVATVQKIGAALQADGIFSDKKETTAKLEKKDTLYVVSLVYDTTKLTPTAVDELHGMALRYSEDDLGGAPVDLVLMDEYQSPLVTYHYRSQGTQLMANGSRFFYSKSVDPATAIKMKDYLIETKFFSDNPMVLALDKRADGYHANYLTKLTAPPAPATQVEMARELKVWSTAVLGGAPLTVDFVDNDMKSIFSIKAA